MAVDPRALGLYVLTSSSFRDRDHASVAEAAIRGGATAIQLRAPELDDPELLPIALRLGAECRRTGVLFVVNDRVDVARVCGAGVHVGQDVPAERARRLVGRGRVLGVSVGSVEEARAATAGGADYLGVTVWSTATKPEAAAVGPDGLRAIVDAVSAPVVAIGGIGPANARQALDAGATGLAVISAVADADDPESATRELRAIVDAAADDTTERPDD